MMEHIQNDTKLYKVSLSRRLDYGMDFLEELLRRVRAISFCHVHRDGNMVVDSLVYVGMDTRHMIVGEAREELTNMMLMTQYKSYVSHEKYNQGPNETSEQ